MNLVGTHISMEGVMLSHKRLRTLLPLGYVLMGMLLLISVSCSDNPTGQDGSSDLWAVASPESQNMDSETLNELTQKIAAGEFGDINSIVIVKNGKLVYEEYFNGASRDNLNLASAVTMNIASTLVGCALDEGKLASLDEKILPYFDDYGIPDNMSAWKINLTVGDILQMKSGFAWDELTLPLSDPGNSYNAMINSTDCYQYVLNLKMETEPGAEWNYNSGAAMLLARVIESSTGLNAEQYAKEKIFQPLGITNYKWFKWFAGSEGIPNTANGLRMRAVDMAKIAYLYMNDGMWNGKQIVSSDWVSQATTPSTDFGDHGYGYMWWVAYIDDNGETRYMPCASGYGDQNIMYCTDYDLVIVTQAVSEKNTASAIEEIVTDYIKPSIKD